MADEIATRPSLAADWHVIKTRPSFAAADIWTRFQAARLVYGLIHGRNPLLAERVPGYEPTTSCFVEANFASVATSRFRWAATSSGGVWASQSVSEMSL